MNRNNLSYFFKAIIIVSGAACFAWALYNLDTNVLGWKFLIFLVFALFVLSRMSLRLPHSNFAVSFSDPIIFITFLMYGGETAIVVATLEMVANCFYLRSNKVFLQSSTFAFNVFSISLTTALTFFIWSLIPKLAEINLQSSSSRDLIIILGFLALSQFVLTSSIVTIAYSLKDNENLWQIWKKHCFLTSMTQIFGAAIAGIVYKLINSADFVTGTVALVVFAIAYLNYRQSITEITGAVTQAEQSEREKAETEKLRAEQAEKHIEQLNILLKKEEQIAEELRESKTALEHAAFHDFLTDLPNRAYFVERLNLLIEIGIETSHRYFVLFLDLHRFKNINDSLGHNVGDRVLRLVGKRLIRIVREEDTITRLGGDEFAIILNDLSSIDEATAVANQIYEKLTRPFLLQGNKIFSDLHIGIAPFDAEHKKPEDILRDADIAMHFAKEEGIGVAVFNKELSARHLDRIELEADLRFALERDEFSMHYQPIVSLADGELKGFEALLRWQHRTRGFVPPDKFISIAEETGLIIPITQWILRQTCTQIAEWQKISEFYENLFISVNISGRHLADNVLIKHIEDALKFSDLAPALLTLEVTESVAMENAEQTIQILSKLKEIGVKLSIDDFGTGYSSLNYLHRLPFNTLKIDRSFVHRVGENGENSEILQTIIVLAKNLKMRVVAEGIETKPQFALLRNMGCDLGQGYLMSKPLPKNEMENLLYQKKIWLSSDETQTSNPINQISKEEHLPLF